MDKICQWCYSQKLVKKSNRLKLNERKIDKEALGWLGIKEDNICQSCCDSIQKITERITQGFYRPLDIMLNCHKTIAYNKIPKEIKIVGWLYYLQDHLREHTRGHYFKKRFSKYKDSLTTQ